MSGHGQPFPLSKLAFMYVKRIAEPVAARFIQRAEKDEWFKRHVCLPPAQLYHFYETKIRFRLLNLGKIRVTKVPKMNEKAAIELGANLLAEFCLLSLASALAANEVIKYKQRDREEEERLNRENQELTEAVDKLKRIVEQQNEDILVLKQLVQIYQRNLTVENEVPRN